MNPTQGSRTYFTYVQDQLSGFDAAGSGRIVLKGLGQRVKRFELFIIHLVLDLKGAKISMDNFLQVIRGTHILTITY